jgi:urea transport system permease protein
MKLVGCLLLLATLTIAPPFALAQTAAPGGTAAPATDAPASDATATDTTTTDTPAADPNDPMTMLASDDFDTVVHGIETLATSGNPHAAAIIAALSSGDLVVGPDQKLYIHRDTAYVDAQTDKPAGPDITDDTVTNVRTNNAVRRAADSATGSLMLFSPDTEARRSAAEAVLKSRDPAGLPALDRALANEKDAGIRRVMEQARAAEILSSADST